MNRAEREANPEESFDGGYHLYAEEKHKERVAKNPDRIAYAIQQFEAHGIEYQLKNEVTGHFHCRRKSDDKMFQFYAGTGKIQGVNNARGIHQFIHILVNTGEVKPAFGDVWIAELSFFRGNPITNYIIHIDHVGKESIIFTPFLSEEFKQCHSIGMFHFKLIKKVMDWEGALFV